MIIVDKVCERRLVVELCCYRDEHVPDELHNPGVAKPDLLIEQVKFDTSIKENHQIPHFNKNMRTIMTRGGGQQRQN